MSKLTDKIWEISAPVAEKNGCQIWDIEYVKEAGQWFLRLYIDKQDGGVNISDCEAISRELDEILDEHDLIAQSYTFEVSSAGAERQLKRPSDFERFMGTKVEVKLYTPLDGTKSYSGELLAYEGGEVTIKTSEEEERKFTKAQVAQVRLCIF